MRVYVCERVCLGVWVISSMCVHLVVCLEVDKKSICVEEISMCVKIVESVYVCVCVCTYSSPPPMLCVCVSVCVHSSNPRVMCVCVYIQE